MSNPRDVVVVSAVRTAVGKAKKGVFKDTRPDDLLIAALKGALDKVPSLDAADIGDVVIGTAMPEGEQGMNVARIAALGAGVPDTTDYAALHGLTPSPTPCRTRGDAAGP